uniref:hypothetical protein n=1 Tax=Curtobacterium flaccumfaciens TaxID=2035 RepID=UPI0024A7AD3D
PAIGWPALVLVIVLFVTMGGGRAAGRPQRTRLVTLALLDLAIVVVGLVATLAVLYSTPVG